MRGRISDVTIRDRGRFSLCYYSNDRLQFLSALKSEAFFYVAAK